METKKKKKKKILTCNTDYPRKTEKHMAGVPLPWSMGTRTTISAIFMLLSHTHCNLSLALGENKASFQTPDR
jgi:hypothetical protein